MAGSMKDIKLRIKSVESTMQITKAMELVASSKMRRAKERVEHSRPYFETLHETLTGIAAADPRARSPFLSSSVRTATARAVVDLPQPDSPTRPRVSPFLIWKLTPSTA